MEYKYKSRYISVSPPPSLPQDSWSWNHLLFSFGRCTRINSFPPCQMACCIGLCSFSPFPSLAPLRLFLILSFFPFKAALTSILFLPFRWRVVSASSPSVPSSCRRHCGWSQKCDLFFLHGCTHINFFPPFQMACSLGLFPLSPFPTLAPLWLFSILSSF